MVTPALTWEKGTGLVFLLSAIALSYPFPSLDHGKGLWTRVPLLLPVSTGSLATLRKAKAYEIPAGANEEGLS